jgi:hypothetical protein
MKQTRPHEHHPARRHFADMGRFAATLPGESQQKQIARQMACDLKHHHLCERPTQPRG